MLLEKAQKDFVVFIPPAPVSISQSYVSYKIFHIIMKLDL